MERSGSAAFNARPRGVAVRSFLSKICQALAGRVSRARRVGRFGLADVGMCRETYACGSAACPGHARHCIYKCAHACLQVRGVCLAWQR